MPPVQRGDCVLIMGLSQDAPKNPKIAKWDENLAQIHTGFACRKSVTMGKLNNGSSQRRTMVPLPLAEACITRQQQKKREICSN